MKAEELRIEFPDTEDYKKNAIRVYLRILEEKREELKTEELKIKTRVEKYEIENIKTAIEPWRSKDRTNKELEEVQEKIKDLDLEIKYVRYVLSGKLDYIMGQDPKAEIREYDRKIDTIMKEMVYLQDKKAKLESLKHKPTKEEIIKKQEEIDKITQECKELKEKFLKATTNEEKEILTQKLEELKQKQEKLTKDDTIEEVKKVSNKMSDLEEQLEETKKAKRETIEQNEELIKEQDDIRKAMETSMLDDIQKSDILKKLAEKHFKKQESIDALKKQIDELYEQKKEASNIRSKNKIKKNIEKKRKLIQKAQDRQADIDMVQKYIIVGKKFLNKIRGKNKKLSDKEVKVDSANPMNIPKREKKEEKNPELDEMFIDENNPKNKDNEKAGPSK